MAVLSVKRRSARLGALLGITCIGLAAAACSSNSSPSSSSSSSSSSTKHTGTANVAYAASLTFLNTKVAGPAFTKATGYTFSGRAGASGELEAGIASGLYSPPPNVFEAVGADNITPLQPKFTKWYVQYAGTSMVVAYNPNSKYASQFKAIASGKQPLKNLFTLMETPGFKLGRTDPNIDPQGRDFVEMLELAQMYYHLPANTVTKILGGPPASANSPQIFAESSLDATLQSGQLDAASAFITQAIELHLSYIKLPPQISLCCTQYATTYHNASITIKGTVKHGSPQVIDITTIGKPTAAGIAFVKYTLSPAGLALYRQGGFTVLTPTATGTGVPAAIKSELSG
jgi:molybdate/tungstate transport system substrate-binding protein